MSGTDGGIFELRDAIGGHSIRGTVKRLERMDRHQRAIAFRTLPKDTALDVFEALDPPLQAELLDDLHSDSVLALFNDLDPDVRVEVLGEMPAKVAKRLLSSLSPEEQAATGALLGWPEGSVGRRMNPRVAALLDTMTVEQALAEIQRIAPKVETIYTVCLVGPGRVLTGVTSLRRILIAEPGTVLRDLASVPITANASTHEEEAARLLTENSVAAVPVVDNEGRLLGILTSDDAYRVLERAEDIDAARTGGSEPLDRPYLLTTVPQIWRKRIVWLFVLMVSASLTVSVLDYFEDALAQVVALALFIPLLIGTGGNTGSQAATTVVRAMAVGDVGFRDLPRVAGRELATGAMIGATLGLAVFGPASFVADFKVGTVVALALFVICTLAATMGSVIPIVARRLGADPAVVSAPFIATFVDATGLLSYFAIATLVLGLG